MGQGQRRKAIHHQIGAWPCFGLTAAIVMALAASTLGLAATPAGPTADSQPSRAPGRVVLTGLTTFAPAPAKVAPPTVSPPTTTTEPGFGSTSSSAAAPASVPQSAPLTTAPSTTTTTAAPPTTTTTTTGSSSTFTCADTAGTDVSASLNACLAAAPVGATWNGEGATYLVNEGISVPHSMTLTDATLVDQTAWANLPTLHMAPIITVNRVNDVTLSDLMIYGAHTALGTGGRYQASQAGIRLRSADNVTITQVQTFNTWGDGLETTRNSDVPRLDNSPVMYLLVQGFTSTNAGRDCFSPEELQDSWVNAITCINSARTPINFETDSPTSGSGYDIISNCNTPRINIIEYVYGPIDITGCTGMLGMLIHRRAHVTPAVVTVANTTFGCHRSSPVPCISQIGGNVVLDHDTVGREAGTGKTTDPALSVTGDASMSVVDSTVVPVVGTADSTSTLTITP